MKLDNTANIFNLDRILLYVINVLHVNIERCRMCTCLWNINPMIFFFIIYAKSKNKSEQRIIKLEGSTLFDVANSYISPKLSLLYISNKLSLLTSCNFFLNIILSTVYVSGKTFKFQYFIYNISNEYLFATS